MKLDVDLEALAVLDLFLLESVIGMKYHAQDP